MITLLRYSTKKWENNSIRNPLYIIFTNVSYNVRTLTECESKMYHYNYFSNHLTCYFRPYPTIQSTVQHDFNIVYIECIPWNLNTCTHRWASVGVFIAIIRLKGTTRVGRECPPKSWYASECGLPVRDTHTRPSIIVRLTSGSWRG